MVIGLHGRIGAGKNACARRLALIEPNVVEVSFARKLKESAAALLDCTVDDLEEWKNDPGVKVYLWQDRAMEAGHLDDQTVRSFLQRYGTEAHRDIFGEDFWLDAALPLDRDYTNALYIVTDVRFQNEADRIRAVDGVTVAVIGPDSATGDHPSERPIDCDYAVLNAVRDDDFVSLDRRLRLLLGEIVAPLAA